MFDPDALPLPDLGLRCLGCGYPLAYLAERRCPECGRAVDLDEHVPGGAFPRLIADGEEVRATPDFLELMSAYRLPVVPLQEHFMAMYGPVGSLFSRRQEGPCVAVPRERYLEAVDLVRRWKHNEELPAPPEPLVIDGPWVCGSCGEENPATFEVCWNCQASHASAEGG